MLYMFFKVINKLKILVKLHIFKDDFTIAIKQWSKDKGESNLRYDYELKEKSIVFDLGGYKGDFTFEINRRYDCFVYLFEPLSEFYEVCENRFINNNKIKCFNYGLSDEEGEYLIDKKGASTSIIHKRNSNLTELIKIKNFTVQLNSLNIKNIDLLKINIEGAEFSLMLDIIEKGIISNIKNIQIQYHIFHPNAVKLRNEIRKTLNNTHIEKWNYTFVWESWEIKT